MIYVYYRVLTKVKVDVSPDIIISPGGYNGFYQLGLCHYIKNNFNYENKKILGFSSGAWASLFMCLKKEHSNECVQNIFKQIHNHCPLPKLPSIFKKSIENYACSDFNIKNLHIGMTNVHTKTLYVNNEFLNVKDCVNCCIGSSFVPYVTYKDLFYFYNNKCVFDGGFYYKKYIKKIDTNNVLVLNYRIFRPNYNKNGRLFVNFKKPKRTLYELYLLGYNNARNNHDYLKRFFHSDSYSSNVSSLLSDTL
jgi:hypothetical protein